MTNTFQLNELSKKTNPKPGLSVFFVDAFVNGPGTGNPAGVCLLKAPISEKSMQEIAFENAQPVTAFLLIREDKTVQIRWFTPTDEVNLCGHASLASAHVLFSEFGHGPDVLTFSSRRHGDLRVTREGEFIQLNFPALYAKEVPVTARHKAIFSSVYKAYKADRLILLLKDEEEINQYQPDLDQIRALDEYAVGISALSKNPEFDITSRYFAPHIGVDEDPVCGSLHCYLAPIWAGVLKKTKLQAFHASPRSGVLNLDLIGQNVRLAGKAITKYQMIK